MKYFNDYGLKSDNNDWIVADNEDYFGSISISINKNYIFEKFNNRLMSEYDILSYSENDYTIDYGIRNIDSSHLGLTKLFGHRYEHDVEIYLLLLISNLDLLDSTLTYKSKLYKLSNMLNFERSEDIFSFIDQNMWENVKTYKIYYDKPTDPHRSFNLNGSTIYVEIQ